jgi:GNAT superfamily N-acetyltransferase
MEIRPVEPEDLTVLNELYGELTGYKAEPERMVHLYELIRRDPNYHLLGAYGEEGLAGTLMGVVCYDLVKDCRPFMVIENVVVAELSRGRGYGKALMLEAERLAESEGCAYLMLVSGAKRKDAHSFYESLGYGEDKVEGFRKKLKD